MAHRRPSTSSCRMPRGSCGTGEGLVPVPTVFCGTVRVDEPPGVSAGRSTFCVGVGVTLMSAFVAGGAGTFAGSCAVAAAATRQARNGTWGFMGIGFGAATAARSPELLRGASEQANGRFAKLAGGVGGRRSSGAKVDETTRSGDRAVGMHRTTPPPTAVDPVSASCSRPAKCTNRVRSQGVRE